jgi:hypothetical protein
MNSRSRALIVQRVETLQSELSRAHAALLAAFDGWRVAARNAPTPAVPEAVTETACRTYELIGALCGTLEELSLLDAREALP